MSPADMALLSRWTEARDAEAFAEIVSRYSGLVYHTARRVLRNSADAEDVAQECFLELSRTGPRIRTSLGGWLHTVATHRALDRIRSQARRRAREAEHQERAAARQVDWDTLLSQVDDVLTELDEDLATPLVQHFLLGRTHDDIAAELGLSRSAVTTRIGRGVEEVRRRLSERGLLIAAGALTAGLATLAAEAAPATLVATLGKIALTGASHAPSGAAIGGLLAGAKLKIAAVVVCAIAAGFYLAPKLQPPQPPAPAVVQNQNQRAVPPPGVARDATASQPANAPVAQFSAPAESDPINAPRASAPQLAAASEAALANREVAESAARQHVPGAREAVLTGFILDGDTGAALPYARIAIRVISGTSSVECSADAVGIYRAQVEPGPNRAVIVKASNYITGLFGVDLATGEHVRRDFRLEPGHSLDVRVVDDLGQPVEGVQLGIFAKGDRSGRALAGDNEMLPKMGKTDRDGRFHFDAVYRDRAFQIRAHKSGYENAYADHEGGFANGDPAEIMITMEGGAAGLFAGRVVDSSGVPLEGIEVSWHRPQAGHESTTTDARGNYRLEAHRAKSRNGGELTAKGRGWMPSSNVTVGLQPGSAAEPTQVDFELQTGRQVSGVVVDEQGLPINEAQVALIPNDPRLTSYLSAWRGTTDKEGRFVFEDIPAPKSTFLYCKKAGRSATHVDQIEPGNYLIRLRDLGVIIGRVVDAENESPISEFQIKTTFPGLTTIAPQTFSSSAGEFEINGVSQDYDCRLIIEAEGYRQLELKQNQHIRSAPREQAEPITIRLQKK